MKINVMSFNLRYSTAPDGAQSWEHRKDLVIERIRTFNPDLLGLQECRADEQAAFIKNALRDYEFIGVARGGEGESALEMAPVLYKREAFAEIERGHFWLSKTPNVPATKSWGAIFPRMAIWVKLQPRTPQAMPVIFLNTHFDYESTSREESARLLKRWAMENIKMSAIIVTGDFNAHTQSQAYHTLAEANLFSDALKGYNEQHGTYHDFGRAKVFETIDWILISQHFTVQQASIDVYQFNGLYPSDHFPVTAQLNLSPL